MSFDLLGLSDKLLAAVKDAGYEEPTPIQKQAIPGVLMGRDVLGIAQTGTGKTASFTLPMIDILSEGKAKARIPRTLILEPTRELAMQIQESFEKYGKNHKLTTALLIGGTSFGDQEQLLDRGVDVLIATPGRLLDHFERGKLMLTGIEILVIDEADRMLDMGFIPDVEKIRGLITRKPQTLFFSATMPPPIKKLTDAFLTDPKFIEVAPPTSTAETVQQNFVKVPPRAKGKTLQEIVEKENVKNALIFCNRKRDVSAVYKLLKNQGLNVRELHGDMAQSERMEVLKKFKGGEITYLVASDVAARGLDIPDVSHVINYDVPQNVEDYIHRIGRTGRAGKEGHAILLVTPRELEQMDKIQAQAKVNITPLKGGKQPQKAQKQGKKDHPKSKPKAQQKAKGPKGQKPHKQKGKKGGGKPERKGRHQIKTANKGDDNPVGMGDHVPAFLKVSTPAKKKAS